ncbi:hypothetical protein H5410_045439 [Solanum commersonii]|uniref:Uncharacterized protein n=1 Tax=Solanum commersonii TaxID=4109 RepID=A0A9J5XBL9_SOLCO|nr:hypothetical protein H5410_045439 [Solanum commersonii]
MGICVGPYSGWGDLRYCSIDESPTHPGGWKTNYYLSGPWLIGGDFNVILGEDEKTRVFPYTFKNLFVGIEHLARTGSDHAPFLLTCGGLSQSFKKAFRFLKFWTDRVDFKDMVKAN